MSLTPITASTVGQSDSNETAQPVLPKTEDASLGKQNELDPKLALYARKERALRRQSQELKAKEEAFKAKETEYTSGYISKSRLKTDPLSVLLSEGISYEDLTQAILNQGNPESAAVQSLKSEIEKIKESQTQSQTQAYEQAVKQIRSDVKTLVRTDENYELIRENDAAEDVVDLIKEVFEKGWEDKELEAGTVLSVKEASDFIENYLLEDSLKRASFKKVQQKLAPKTEEPKTPTSSEGAPLKTLTNAVAATSSKPLTQRERIERAKLAFLGQLNK